MLHLVPCARKAVHSKSSSFGRWRLAQKPSIVRARRSDDGVLPIAQQAPTPHLSGWSAHFCSCTELSQHCPYACDLVFSTTPHFSFAYRSVGRSIGYEDRISPPIGVIWSTLPWWSKAVVTTSGHDRFSVVTTGAPRWSDRKSTRLNSSHTTVSRMPSSA